jgi:acetylornithine deacetylase/succinyl-diaminopimelate desuccinylase-like protein
VGEEGHGDLRGMRHYLDTHPAPAAVIALDSPGDTRIVIRGLGVRRYRVTVSAPGGHSWVAYGTPGALPVALDLAQAVQRLAAPLPVVQRGAGVALTIATLAAGSAINAIPEQASMELDVRALDDGLLDQADRAIATIVRRAQRAGDGVVVTLSPTSRRPAGSTRTDAPLVIAAVSATRQVGRAPVFAAGSTDANAAMARGIPAIAIGAGGSGGRAHTVDEWFDPTDGAVGVVRLLSLLRQITSAGTTTGPDR